VLQMIVEAGGRFSFTDALTLQYPHEATRQPE
jgi:hypothetical protein